MSQIDETWIAVRKYTVEASGEGIEVKIAVPVQVGILESASTFSVAGPPEVSLGYDGRGIDSIQALQQAMEGLRAALLAIQAREPIRFAGGRGGNIGFYKRVPNEFGMELAERLSAVIDDEVERHVAALRARARR